MHGKVWFALLLPVIFTFCSAHVNNSDSWSESPAFLTEFKLWGADGLKSD